MITMRDAFLAAQELTHELIDWQRDKDPLASVPALLVAAAKISAATDGDLEQMVSLLRTAFDEEAAKLNRNRSTTQ
jgi:hypothetical protein